VTWNKVAGKLRFTSQHVQTGLWHPLASHAVTLLGTGTLHHCIMQNVLPCLWSEYCAAAFNFCSFRKVIYNKNLVPSAFSFHYLLASEVYTTSLCLTIVWATDTIVKIWANNFACGWCHSSRKSIVMLLVIQNAIDYELYCMTQTAIQNWNPR
jgi:hypothetical protein